MTIPDAIVEIDTVEHALSFDLTDAIARQDAVTESRIRFAIGVLLNLRSSLLEKAA